MPLKLPGRPNVKVSSNGSSWTVVASCYGNGSPETATFSTRTAQYVEVVLTTPEFLVVDHLFRVFARSGTTTPSVGDCAGSTSGESPLAEPKIFSRTDAWFHRNRTGRRFVGRGSRLTPTPRSPGMRPRSPPSR